MKRYSARFIEERTGADCIISKQDLDADGLQAAIDEALARAGMAHIACTAIDIFEDDNLVERVGVGESAGRA